MDFDKLQAYLKENKNKPFEWGTHDCCLFAANAVLAATGKDFAATVRGKYKTELGAARVLAKYGNGDLQSTVTELVGQPVANLLGRRGDIVMVDINGVKAIGIKLVGAVVLQQDGLLQVPADNIITTWRAY